MINNISHGIPAQQSELQALHSSLVFELDALRDRFRRLLTEYDNNPSQENLTKLTAFMYQMRTFLETHKEEIFNQARKNGWPAIGPGDGYEGFYKSAILTLNTFLNPEYSHNEGNLTFLNEQFTQLTWLVSTDNTVKY